MLKVDFSAGYNEITVKPGLTQWDKGQKLEIGGLELPAVAQVHFANSEADSAIIHMAYKQDNGNSEVLIPNSLLQEPHDIRAYIYVTDENEGKTVKTIHVPVTPRTKPDDFISEPDPTQTQILDEMIAYANHIGNLVAEYKRVSNIRIMTKAEYEALEEKDDECIYAFSDDSTLDEIEDMQDGTTPVEKSKSADKILIGDTYYSLKSTTDSGNAGEDGYVTFIVEE